MPDVFISYSRKDKTFVEKLVTALEAKKRDVWVDFEDIPFAADWWEEIQKGIASRKPHLCRKTARSARQI